jgi:cell division protein FtsB
MNETQSLDAALKSAPTVLKQFVRDLKSENLKLQKQIAKLYAENVSKDHRIVSLKGELKKLGYKHPSEVLAERLRRARARVAPPENHAPTP